MTRTRFTTPVMQEITLDSLGLGVDDTPEFAGLNLSGNLAVGGYTQLGIDGPRLYGNGSASAALWTNDESSWADFAAYGISLEQAGSINWGDVLLSRGSGLTVDSRATGGFRSINSAGTASAPISASTGTFSGALDLPVSTAATPAIKSSGQINGSTTGIYWPSSGNGDMNFASRGVGIARVMYDGLLIDGNLKFGGIAGTGDTVVTRGATGPTIDSRAAGGFRSRTLDGSAAAPFSASTGAFSDTVTSGSFGFGFDASVGSMRVHQDAGYFVGSRGRIIAPSATTLHACADSGLKVRNYANTADAPITAGLITSNLNSSNTAAETLVDWQQSQSGGKKHFYVKNGSSNPAVVATMEIGINDAIGYGGKLIANVAGVSQCVGVGSSNATLFNATSTIMGIPGQLRMGASPAGYAGFAGDVHLVAAASGNLSVYQGNGTTLGNIQAAYHKGTHFGYLDGAFTGMLAQSNAAVMYAQGTQVCTMTAGAITASGHIGLSANNTYDIGSSTNYVRQVHTIGIKSSGMLALNASGTGYGGISTGANGFWDTDDLTVRSQGGTTRTVTNADGFKVIEAIGLWGVTPPAVQPAAPVTLADVITILQTYGLCAA